jgi:U4/U6 small nuclear ribonucleoprotein PRP4
MQSSEIGDDRPIVACAFSPSGTHLATGAWSGLVKLWASPSCQKELTIKAHENRITGMHTEHLWKALTVLHTVLALFMRCGARRRDTSGTVF